MENEIEMRVLVDKNQAPIPLPYSAVHIHSVSCADGVMLKIKQYTASTQQQQQQKIPKRPPILLCHGLGSNSKAFDYSKEMSLAWFLLRRGYNVWLADLRGSGLSEKPETWHSLDDYIYHDVPTIVHYILLTENVPQIHWLGHSMGGIVVMCSMVETTIQPYIKSVIAIASALEYKDSVYRHLAPLLPLVKFFPSFKQPLIQESSPYLTTSFLNMYPTFLSSQQHKRIQTYFCDIIAESVEPIPLPVLTRLGSSLEQGGLARKTLPSPHEEEDPSSSPRFMDHLYKIEVPLLGIAGNKDVQCPSAAVLRMVEACGSEKKRFVTVGGDDAQDYGHLDLLISPWARTDVFEVICDWLDQVDREYRSSSSTNREDLPREEEENCM